MDAVLGNISDPSTQRKYARPVIAQHCPAHAQFARHVRAMVETSWKDDTCGAFFPMAGFRGTKLTLVGTNVVTATATRF